MGKLYGLGLAIIAALVAATAQIFYLDPALSPVYPFLLLTTLFAIFFLICLIAWGAVSYVRQVSKRNDDEGEVILKFPLRVVLICLVLAFAPVAFLAIQSLHALRTLDIIAICVFEVLAIIYIYKKYTPA